MALKKKIIRFTSLFLVALVAVFSFLLSDFNPMFDDTQFIHLKSELRNENTELNSVISIYEKIDNAKERKTCPCSSILYNVEKYRSGNYFKKGLFVLKVSKEFTKSQCEKFYLSDADFLYGNIGIKNAARFYFSKELNQLTTEEQIILLVMSENPVLFNPLKRREMLMKKVKEYQKLIETNDQ